MGKIKKKQSAQQLVEQRSSNLIYVLLECCTVSCPHEIRMTTYSGPQSSSFPYSSYLSLFPYHHSFLHIVGVLLNSGYKAFDLCVSIFRISAPGFDLMYKTSSEHFGYSCQQVIPFKMGSNCTVCNPPLPECQSIFKRRKNSYIENILCFQIKDWLKKKEKEKGGGLGQYVHLISAQDGLCIKSTNFVNCNSCLQVF